MSKESLFRELEDAWNETWIDVLDRGSGSMSYRDSNEFTLDFKTEVYDRT